MIRPTVQGDARMREPRTDRTRDPARKDKILAAAADLVGRNGFHGVSMSDIGNRAGITGSGIYRHFKSKDAILAALFDQVIDELLEDERTIIDSGQELTGTLTRLVAQQVDFVVTKRELARIYYSEIQNLPQEEKVVLRRKQRLYLEEWVHLLREIRAELDDAEARTLIHTAIGAIQSPLFHNDGLAPERLKEHLMRAAVAVLDLRPS